jgi:hypothetical protein
MLTVQLLIRMVETGGSASARAIPAGGGGKPAARSDPPRELGLAVLRMSCCSWSWVAAYRERGAGGVPDGRDAGVVVSARARTWSPVTVSCSRSAAVSWLRAGLYWVSRSRARVSAWVRRRRAGRVRGSRCSPGHHDVRRSRARPPSNTTCTRSSPRSTPAPGTSSTAPWPATETRTLNGGPRRGSGPGAQRPAGRHTIPS